MEKKIAVIIATILATVIVTGCAILEPSQPDDPGSTGDKLIVSDIKRPAEEPSPYDGQSATEEGSIIGVGADSDGVADKGVNPGSDADSGSSNGDNPDSSGQNTPSWPGGKAPADDGSTTKGVTYSEYHAMSAEEQQAWLESFDSVEAFFEWHNEAKAVHDANDDSIIIDGNTSIDIGEIAK